MRHKNPNSETSILSPLVEFLEICSNQGRLRYFRAHPVRLITKDKKTFPVKVRPSQLGVPDTFVWIPPEGQFGIRQDCWIEGKSKDGTVSKDQKVWRQYAELVGIPYFQPRSHADVGKIIEWIRERI